MDNKKSLEKVDTRFLTAVNEIIDTNKQLKIKPKSESAVSSMIYSTRGMISEVKRGLKNVPKAALVNMAQKFDVNMNYFFNDNQPLNYKPPIERIEVKEFSAISEGNQNNNTNLHVGKAGDIKVVNHGKSDFDNTQVEHLEVETMINNFVSQINEKYVDDFYNILTRIRKDNLEMRLRLEKLVNSKYLEYGEIDKAKKKELNDLKEELSSTREKLEESRNRENDILQKYIARLENTKN